jgi:hypothetical protein
MGDLTDVGSPAGARCVRVLSRPQLREAIEEIRRPDRAAAVVAVTSRPGERDPALCPTAVREIVGSSALLLFIPTGHLTRALAVSLGERLAVEGGAARIWWARPSGRTAARHPSIAAPGCGEEPSALAELARQLKATRPLTPEHLDAIERERAAAEARGGRLTAALAAQRHELEHAHALLQATRVKLAEVEAQLRLTRGGPRRRRRNRRGENAPQREL